jgi:hypothetical protein
LSAKKNIRRAQIWSKKAARDHERLKREIAEREEKGRSDSEDRREGINAFWDLDEQQLRAAKNPKERKLKEQELKAKKLKELLKSVRDSTRNNDLVDRVVELIELAALQDCEIEYLMQFRCDWERIQAHYPEQLESLSTASLFTWLQPFGKTLTEKATPKQKHQRGRRIYTWLSGVGQIGYEFGGAGEAAFRKMGNLSGLPYEPSCLDNIFVGGVVHMDDSEGEMTLPPYRIIKPGLQSLFGMDKNQFPKDLPSFKNPHNRRERLYKYRAVRDSMRSFLSEKLREHKRPARGRPLKRWLNDPDLRKRVLNGIEARIKSLSVPEQIKPHIKADFLAVVHRHLADSAKK